MKKKITALVLVILMLVTAVPVSAGTSGDETVYAKLNQDGTVSGIRVVRHIRGFENGGFVTEYGSYRSIRNLCSDIKPEIDGEVIKWPADILKNGDFYYEGEISKELPAKIDIKYFLDEKQIKGDDLSGRNGHLKMQIGLNFNKGKSFQELKFMAQIQVSLDNEVFSNISTGDGNKTVVGRKSTVVFTVLPNQEENYTLEMDGKDIYMDPVTITLVPAEFSLPKDMDRGFHELNDGLGLVESNASKLENGMAGTIDGSKDMKKGIEDLGSGIAAISNGASQLSKGSAKILAGMGEINDGLRLMASQSGEFAKGIGSVYGGIQELSKRSSEIYGGIKSAYAGSKKFSKEFSAFGSGMDNLYSINSDLTRLAMELQNSSDERVRTLAQGVIGQSQIIEGLREGTQRTGKGLAEMESGLGEMYEGYGKFNEGLAGIEAGMKDFSEKAGSFPESIEGMSKGFDEMYRGTEGIFKGYSDIDKSLEKVKSGSDKLPLGMDSLIKGQDDIKEGIHSLNYNGIKKIRAKFSEALDEFLNKADGEAISFVDSRNTGTSSIQFILQTEGIKKVVGEKKYENKTEEKKGFFEWFIDLFRW